MPSFSTKFINEVAGDGRGRNFEMNGRRARVVGFTHGIRSFTTSPYVFTTFKRAQEYSGLAEDQTIFILVKLAPGADLDRCAADYCRQRERR